MPRAKKAAKEKNVSEPSIETAKEIPSDACKTFLTAFIVKFYEAETTVSLDAKYVRYQEECLQKFKMDMMQKMLDALHVPEWHQETDKRGFTKFMENRVHDALWNAKVILTMYGSVHRANNQAFEELILKVDLFVGRCKPFAKRCNRRGSMGWWNSEEGVAELNRGRRHFITLPKTTQVIPQDEKIMKGGYATIRRVRIEGCPGIASSWEFAAKLSNHHRTQPQLAKLEHQNESMAMRIPHDGVIRFFAVHARQNEGYSFWWNGGTLRQMLNMDHNYPDNIFIWIYYDKNISVEEEAAAYRLQRFRKKRTEFAWALLHIMHAVHTAGHLHNDISLDNIMFHFPADESLVYIGVCDWGMTSLAAEPPKSLYTFASASNMNEALRKRWWVAPSIAYLHRRDADVEIIPHLSHTSEEYAVGKIAQAINKSCMSEEYYKLHRKTPNIMKLSHTNFASMFESYLRRLCLEGDDHCGGFAHIFDMRMSNQSSFVEN